MYVGTQPERKTKGLVYKTKEPVKLDLKTEEIKGTIS